MIIRNLNPLLVSAKKTPEFYDEIAYYCHTQHYQLKLTPSEWIKLLIEKFKGAFAPRSIVTKLVVEDGKVTSLLVNGTKKISGHNFIFCGELKSLEFLIPQDLLHAKARNKIAKTKTWTRASLQIDHKHEVTNRSDLHILIGTAHDEVVTCVGHFQNNLSTWTTFVSDEDSEDPEITAQALKRIKRQIKRAYPEALNAPHDEKIVVQSEFGGHFDLKLNANQTWPEIENLWIASGGVQTERNLLGALKRAWLVLASLGFSVQTPAVVSTDVVMETTENRVATNL